MDKAQDWKSRANELNADISKFYEEYSQITINLPNMLLKQISVYASANLRTQENAIEYLLMKAFRGSGNE